jgi:N-acetylglutamate synthase-like GNAT family acetyltransferase
VDLPVGQLLRHAREDDHRAIVDGIGRWWDVPDPSRLQGLMPRLFLQHFAGTSWIVESESGELGAFLVGFRSQDHPEVAYIHFIGVDPELRRAHIASQLYELFFAQMQDLGCTEVHAITGPPNRRSQQFHAAMGFTAHGDEPVDGVMAYRDYDGPGEARVAFTRSL